MESARSLEELEGHSPSLQSTDDIASVKLSLATENTESSSSSLPTLHCAGTDLEKNATTPEKSSQVSDDVYRRFSQRKKRAIVAIVSFAALLARTSTQSYSKYLNVRKLHNAFAAFASSSFLPSIPQISRDLGVSQVIITQVSLKWHKIRSSAYIFTKLYFHNIPDCHWRGSSRLVTIFYLLCVISVVSHCFLC